MKRFVLASCAIGIAACTSSTAPTAERAFELQLGHQTAVAGTPFLITFAGVIEDSRCPTGALCIQAGRAEVELAVSYLAAPPTPRVVRLVDRPDSSTALVIGWVIEFLDLLPHPTVGEPPVPEARRVRLIVRPALD